VRHRGPGGRTRKEQGGHAPREAGKKKPVPTSVNNRQGKREKRRGKKGGGERKGGEEGKRREREKGGGKKRRENKAGEGKRRRRRRGKGKEGGGKRKGRRKETVYTWRKERGGRKGQRKRNRNISGPGKKRRCARKVGLKPDRKGEEGKSIRAKATLWCDSRAERSWIALSNGRPENTDNMGLMLETEKGAEQDDLETTWLKKNAGPKYVEESTRITCYVGGGGVGGKKGKGDKNG